MDKSIETIWKEGFIEDKALVAPKINDLYNQKSQNIVDKLKRMFDLNLKGVAIGGVVILLALSVLGLPYLGLFVCAVAFYLVFKGYQQFKDLNRIKNNTNSYEYIKTFDTWMKKVMQEYTQMYRVIYPALFLACIVRFGMSEVGLSIINGVAKDLPSIPSIMGVPVLISGGVILVAFLLSYFAGAIYKFDMQTLYGRQFQKLEEIIADMESLQESKS